MSTRSGARSTSPTFAKTGRLEARARSCASTTAKDIPTARPSTAKDICGSRSTQGWEARRYAPSGELVERVRFPVSNITKIAFGGDNLRTAFESIARQMPSAEQIAEQSLIGALFEFRAEVWGILPLVRI